MVDFINKPVNCTNRHKVQPVMLNVGLSKEIKRWGGSAFPIREDDVFNTGKGLGKTVHIRKNPAQISRVSINSLPRRGRNW